jgi:hypothetical protein
LLRPGKRWHLIDSAMPSKQNVAHSLLLTALAVALGPLDDAAGQCVTEWRSTGGEPGTNGLVN